MHLVGLGTEKGPIRLELASLRSLDAEETSSTAVGIPLVRENSVGKNSRHEEETSRFDENSRHGEGTASFMGKEAPRYPACSRDEQDNVPLLGHHVAPTSKSWFGPNGLLSSRRVRSLFCLELLIMVRTE